MNQYRSAARGRRVLLGISIILFICIFSPGQAVAGDSPVDPTGSIPQDVLDNLREDRHIGILPEMEPGLDPGLNPSPSAVGATVSGTWGQVYLHALTGIAPNTNVDIFRENADGTDPVNLTNSPGDDLSLRLSPDRTRIVFTSNRDGDFEIYIMDTDGSNLVQVTSNTWTDSRPYWSPDGTQLVYAANERGRYEIYRINADGSGKTRLSNYSDGYNAYEPAWAPDNSLIAFVLSDKIYSSGEYVTRNRLFAMDINGTNPRILAAGLECSYIGDLVWSDDSRYLSHDYIPYFSYVTLIMIYNKDMSDPLSVSVPQLPGHISDQWNAGFSPSGNELLYTQVHYELKYSRLIAVAMTPMVYCLPGHECRREPLQATLPFSFDPSMTQNDFSAPTVTMEPLPEYERGYFNVRWSGTDSGVAGVYGYELQRRLVGATAWQDEELPEQARTYFMEWANRFLWTGQADYYLNEFRVRAYDRAGNLSPWDAGGNSTSTRRFNGSISGSIFDNRGLQLENADVVFNHDPLNALDYLVGPAFEAYYDEWTSIQLNVGKTGYESAPGMNYNLVRDYKQDFYLPFSDDLIVNGTFEDSMNGWTLGGDLMPESSVKEWFTGTKSVQLGTDCGGMCLSGIDGPTINGYDINTVIDSQDTIHYLLRTSTNEVRYYTRTADGTWADPEILYSGLSSPKIKLFLLADDSLVATLIDNGGNYLEFRTRQPLGDWSPVEQIDDPDLYYREVVVDHQGSLLILVSTVVDSVRNYFFQTRLSDGSWLDTVMLKSYLSYVNGGYSFVMDESGVIMLLNRDPDQDSYQIWNEAGYLGEEFFLNPDKAPGAQDPVLLFSASDVVNESQYLFWNRHTPLDVLSFQIQQGVWPYTPFTDFSTEHGAFGSLNRDHSLQLLLTNPSLDPNQLVDIDPYRLPVNIGTLPYTYYLIGYDSFNNPHLRTTGYLHHRSSQLAVTDLTSVLSQQVTLPAEMNKPTLSFLTMIDGGGPLEAGSSFDVVIDDGEVETTVFSENTNHPWQHHWLDLGDYVGQTVTIHFLLDQKAGDPVIHVNLDDVSLSGWNVVTLSSVAPTTCLSDATPVTLTGTNFATALVIALDGQALDPAAVEWVSDTTVLLHLPPGFQPGVYDLTVTNPGGFEDTLPSALIVGCPVFVPFVENP